MPFATDSPMRVTLALRRAESAPAALAALAGSSGLAKIEGLCELIEEPHTAAIAVAAISALECVHHPLIHEALRQALHSPYASVRIAALGEIRRRGANRAIEECSRLLQTDTSWTVRRAALMTLADSPTPHRWRALNALNDPHWRVRHALVRILLAWSETTETRQEIERRLDALGGDARVRGMIDYFRYRVSGRRRIPSLTGAPTDAATWCPFWDDDPAVLARALEDMGAEERAKRLAIMPRLLGHEDEAVRRWALDALRRDGETEHLAEALCLLDEPRHEAFLSATRLFERLDLDRVEATARFVLHAAHPSPAQLAWAIDRAGVAFPIEEEEPALRGLLEQADQQPRAVRLALARLAARWPCSSEKTSSSQKIWLRRFLEDGDPSAPLAVLRTLSSDDAGKLLLISLLEETSLREALSHSPSEELRAETAAIIVTPNWSWSVIESLANDPSTAVRQRVAAALASRNGDAEENLLSRLQIDPHPRVRAAAMTPARARALAANPQAETSWRVLSEAARLAKVPFRDLEPRKPWKPSQSTEAIPPSIPLAFCEPPHARKLAEGIVVAPLAISGHYGLPVEGFSRAVSAGVNLFFWEPNYATLSEFASRIPSGQRNGLHFVAGTFEAKPERIRRDAERALRMLRLERLAVFLLFWTRSWRRITDDAREILWRLRDEGKVANFSLSTHDRALAAEAIRAGWNPIMVRHSAAHRGTESEVLPLAARHDVGLLAFNSTCYGRLLRPLDDSPGATAADCYRYTLSQPGVTACWSAPSSLDELDENLRVLHDLELPEERRERLLAHGARVYQEDAVFGKLIRGR